jgi:hypothetical protein
VKCSVQLDSGRLSICDGLSSGHSTRLGTRTWYSMCRRVLHNLSRWLTRLLWHIVIVGDEPDAWHGSTSGRTGYYHPLYNPIFDELSEAGLKKAAISFGRVQEPLKDRGQNR